MNQKTEEKPKDDKRLNCTHCGYLMGDDPGLCQYYCPRCDLVNYSLAWNPQK